MRNSCYEYLSTKVSKSVEGHGVYIVTCRRDRLCHNKEVISIVRALPLGLFPSDKKLVDEEALFPVGALQQVAHILLNLLGFLNG